MRSKKGFICDMDGVIYHGDRLLPGVQVLVAWLKAEGKKFLFLTNSSERSPRELMGKLGRLGIEVENRHFYTSAQATASFLASQRPSGSAYVIGGFILANDIVAPHEWRMPHKTYPAVRGKDNYLKAVKDIIDSKKTKTVMIWGYHKSWHGVLTLKDLDKVTGEVPTIIWQRSTHELYSNTACAKKIRCKKR